MPSDRTILEIAVPLHIERTFHYLVPERLETRAMPGRRALVPFGRRILTGYILTRLSGSPLENLKEIREVLDNEPLWTDQELDFFRWAATYYLHPLGDVLKSALPAGINVQQRLQESGETAVTSARTTVRHERYYRFVPEAPMPDRKPGSKALEILESIRESGELNSEQLRRRFGTCLPQLKRLTDHGLITVEQREIYRDPFRDSVTERDQPRQLVDAQAAALGAICSATDRKEFAPFLLHGVTGSGKTEVYLQAIAHTLKQGRNALVLVPEIALTPQLTGRFRARFDCGIAILHSGLTDGERYDEWRRIRRGEVRIVIGARSAIFAPLEQIGIIVVDEEHEGSFKQGDGLRYNARDLALVRGRQERSVVVLGSATPLATSLFAAGNGRLTLLTLPERVAARPMPTVELVSMKGKQEAISEALHAALEQTLAEGQQAIVFLNRRGFATFLVCADCGNPLTCPNCSVTLTYHRQRGESVCHYCDYTVPAPGTCPACGAMELQELGAGTERLEHDLKEAFPLARILRMDSDTTAGRGGHERLLSRMADGSADILVGTQMIAKGHDFPGVTLVGVISADASLGVPDFRAGERTFQLLSQVIGRAGRGELPGRVIVQTLNAEHYAIRCAVTHDHHGFYTQELEFRQEVGYPPFSHLAVITISGISEETVEKRAAESTRLLTMLKQKNRLRIEILGPAQAPLYRLRGRFRRQILLKAPSRPALRTLIMAWRDENRPLSTIREAIDIDPLDMM